VDGIDLAACLLARHHIRTIVLPGALGLAATGALLSAWLSRQLDAPPPSNQDIRRDTTRGAEARSRRHRR
jgi:hypothetical protein